MAKRKPINLDDGFRPDLVENAIFDGIFEIPSLNRISENKAPVAVVPFSARNHTSDFNATIVFYEKDNSFKEVIQKPELFVEDFKRFSGGITSPDCSLYRDSPLIVQMANVYRNRALGFFFQEKGITVIPNVRWGDNRSYTKKVLPERFAFAGIPKDSVVSIGTYGCIQGVDNKCHFEAGLEAMLTELNPKVVVVYGRMPDQVFGKYKSYTKFINFSDWTSAVKKQEEY